MQILNVPDVTKFIPERCQIPPCVLNASAGIVDLHVFHQSGNCIPAENIEQSPVSGTVQLSLCFPQRTINAFVFLHWFLFQYDHPLKQKKTGMKPVASCLEITQYETK